MGYVKYDEEWRISFSVGVVALLLVGIAMVRFRVMWWRTENNVFVGDNWTMCDTLLQPWQTDFSRVSPAHACWGLCVLVILCVGVTMLFLYA